MHRSPFSRRKAKRKESPRRLTSSRKAANKAVWRVFKHVLRVERCILRMQAGWQATVCSSLRMHFCAVQSRTAINAVKCKVFLWHVHKAKRILNSDTLIYRNNNSNFRLVENGTRNVGKSFCSFFLRPTSHISNVSFCALQILNRTLLFLD